MNFGNVDLKLILKNYNRDRAVFAVSNGKRDSPDAELLGNLRGSAMKQQHRTPAGRVANFNTLPCYAARGPCTQRLHCRLFGSKPGCKSFDGILFALAVPKFARCKDALQKAFAEAGDRRCDTWNFADVNSGTDDHAVPDGSDRKCCDLVLLIYSTGKKTAIDAQDFPGHKAGRLGG